MVTVRIGFRATFRIGVRVRVRVRVSYLEMYFIDIVNLGECIHPVLVEPVAGEGEGEG